MFRNREWYSKNLCNLVARERTRMECGFVPKVSHRTPNYRWLSGGALHDSFIQSLLHPIVPSIYLMNITVDPPSSPRPSEPEHSPIEPIISTSITHQMKHDAHYDKQKLTDLGFIGKSAYLA
jgi:hypothetical protein